MTKVKRSTEQTLGFCATENIGSISLDIDCDAYKYVVNSKAFVCKD